MKIGDREIGDGHPCMIVAELGINHGGSVETALEMVRAAALAGADAVKVQSFEADSFCTEAATWKGESQREMFRRYQLGPTAIAAIAHECRAEGVMFFGTPDSARQAEILLACGAPCLKVGSDDLVHIPLLRQLARFHVPMILSTGMASYEEIAFALDAVGVGVVLLHCVSEYPTSPQHANMKRMAALGERMAALGDAFYVPVGYSDHTDGIVAAIGAVWAGACIIEKHFTLDRNSDGPDHSFSADPGQLSALVQLVRETESMLGDGSISPGPEELAMRVTARRSIVASGTIPAGTKLTHADLAYKRPGDGLPPRTADAIVGKVLTRSLFRDEPLREGDWK